MQLSILRQHSPLRARADCRLALVRSRIRSRSNSSKAPHRWKVNRPGAVVVSRFFCSEANCRSRAVSPLT